MGLEISRRLVGGRWRTGSAEEGTGGGGGGGSQTVLSVTKAISSAEILALKNTPVAVLAGVAGKTILPFALAVTYLAGETPYTDHVGQISLDYTGVPGDHTLFGFTSAGFWDQAASQIASQGYGAATATGAASTLAGLGIQIGLAGEFAENPTDGDGTLVVYFAYVLVPVA